MALKLGASAVSHAAATQLKAVSVRRQFVASRPFGITALTLVFEALAVSLGFLALAGLFNESSETPVSTALLFLLNAAISAAVAIGLHRWRWWVRRATRFWSASAVAVLLWFFLGPDHGLPVPFFAVLPFGSGLFGFCWILEIYVPYALESAA